NRNQPLEEAIQKADVLIEALGWIRSFRDKVTVIKLGGSVMDDDSALRHMLVDTVFMETVGTRVVLVHDGAKATNRARTETAIQPLFIHVGGYTDDATQSIVEKTL